MATKEQLIQRLEKILQDNEELFQNMSEVIAERRLLNHSYDEIVVMLTIVVTHLAFEEILNTLNGKLPIEELSIF